MISHLNAGPTQVWMVGVDNVSEVMSGAVIPLFDSKLDIVEVETPASTVSLSFVRNLVKRFSF